MKHVIVGNGPTGLVAAETLRRLQADAHIVLIGDEPEPPYSRMAIPYFLNGSIEERGTHLRKSPGHFAAQRIRLVEGRVVKIDAGARQVELAGGGRESYDRLLIASGSRPIRPSVPGMDLPDVHTCWTLADARAIAAKAAPGSRVVQVGAGFIGCIIMEALAARGVRLAVVEMGERMVPRMMTATAGDMIRRWVERKGVAVHLNAGVTRIDSARGGAGVSGRSAMKVSLSSGLTLDADLVICAAGVAPNTGFLAGSGIALGRGIRVDAGLRTSVAGIFAAGDVTEAPGFHSGKPEVNAIQPNAADQARVAAHNMAGRRGEFQGSLAINVLDTLGLVSTSFGQWWGADRAEGGEGIERVDPSNSRYLSLQFKGDVLIGATSIGWSAHVGALRGLIQTRTPLGGWKPRLLADPARFMQAYLAGAHKAA